PTLAEFLIFIIFLIFFFFEKMQHNFLVPIYQTINFWICVGLFVYFTGNFFFILLVESSKSTDPQLKNELVIIYSVVTIVKNLILGLSLYNNNENVRHSDNFIVPTDLNLDTFTPNNNLN
ncbi:MAG: hypothetical protein ABIO04_02585, partial [Ferruginibacter sp.]